MRFSMNSYLLGVGTVVGALTLGFGGGVLLTKTAIKDTPSGPSRIERVARPEPAAPAPVQVTEAKPALIPRADPAPALQTAPEPAPQVQAVAENPKTVVEAPKENPAKLAEPVKQPDAPKQMEQPIRQSEAKSAEQKESEQRAAEREQRRAEQRRIDREKRIAERERERKARSVIMVRRQQPIEEQDQHARPELAFEREEPRPNLFEGLFGRPIADSRE